MRVTVIGLGAMGAGMARSTVRAGLSTTVWNRTAAKADPLVELGVDVAADPASAVTDADVVVSVLFDEAATREVLEQALPATRDDVVWVQTATVGPAAAQRLDALATEHGRRLLDAPVLGTKKPAEDGALTVLVSGDAGAIETARPLLDAIGSRTVVVGDTAGPASALKLACNSWVGAITAATGQAVAMAGALGVDPQQVLEAIDGTAVDSPYAHVKGRAMIDGDFTASFEVDGVLKDMDLMLQATAGSLDPTVLQAVRSRFAAASAAGHGADDMAAVVTAFAPEA